MKSLLSGATFASPQNPKEQIEEMYLIGHRDHSDEELHLYIKELLPLLLRLHVLVDPGELRLLIPIPYKRQIHETVVNLLRMQLTVCGFTILEMALTPLNENALLVKVTYETVIMRI